MTGHTDLQQDGGLEEAERVQHDAARHQQGPTSQTGAPQRVQVTGHQAAHQACHSVQQLHPHDHLHRQHTRHMVLNQAALKEVRRSE